MMTGYHLFIATLLFASSQACSNNEGLFGNCGRLSSTCVCEEPVNTPEYLELSADEKLNKIMVNIESDTSSAQWFNPFILGTGILSERMCPVFESVGDELPWEGIVFHGHRKKLIHTVGVVGKVEWKSVGSHPYTGVFTGAQNCLIRMSLASQPDPEEKKTTPGFGLKFLRDGVDSGNFVAMDSVDGQESWNFFLRNFTNNIPSPSLAMAPLAVKFATATPHIGQVGLSNMALYDESGAKTSDPVFPFSLNFVPDSGLSFPDDYEDNVNNQLMTIPAGSRLYRVFAMSAPRELGGEETHIADLVLTSALTTSVWGDRHLYFRHQNMADDLSLRPEWEQYAEKWTAGVQTCSLASQLQ